MDFQNSKMADGKQSVDSITIDFNNIYLPMHALELKEYFGKLAISQKLEEISNVVKRTFYQYKK